MIKMLLISLSISLSVFAQYENELGLGHTYFLYQADFEKESNQLQGLQYYSLLNLNPQKLMAAYEVYRDSLSQADFNSSMQYLRQNAGHFGATDRLYILSLLGSKLAEGYSATGRESVTMEQIFHNARISSRMGGLCGDIHEYLRQSAISLGFEDAQYLVASVWQTSENTGNAHYTLLFKDPQSGEFFTQNYSQIINTRQTDYTRALEVSLRIMGPLTGVSYLVNPETAHKYVPLVARWTEQNIRKITDTSGTNESIYQAQLGNLQSYLAFSKEITFADKTSAKVGIFHSTAKTSEGTYRHTGVGISAQTHDEWPVTFVAEKFGYKVEVAAGVHEIKVPTPDADFNYSDYSDTRFSGFASLKYYGYAVVNSKLTTSNDFEIKTLDIKSASKSERNANTSAGLSAKYKAAYKLTDLLHAYVERKFDALPRDQSPKFTPVMKTAYDKISLVYDNTDETSKAYLIMDGGYYIMEGLGEASAQAVRAIIKASVPVEYLGQVTVLYDASRFAKNKRGDVYYQNANHDIFEVRISRALTNWTTAGVNFTSQKGIIHSQLELPSYLSPEIPSKKRKNRVGVWLSMQF